MIDPIVLLAFVPAALALNMTPGADMMFCLAQGARGGPRPALAASAGISAGVMVHVAAAGLGLGALVAARPGLFDAIRWIGVAYLAWLAWKTLRAPRATGGPPVHPSRAFRDGLLVNLTNPKVIFFILAFVPQFVDPARPVLPQFLLFGGVIALGGFVVNGAVGWFSGSLGAQLAGNPGLDRALRWVTATILVGLALRLALEGRR
jgi:threonine/homoserine/homoserine lactone efflux protein